MVFSPPPRGRGRGRGAREGQKGQIHIQCVLISKTSSLSWGWKLRCQAWGNECCRTGGQLTCPQGAAAPRESQCSGAQGTGLGPGYVPQITDNKQKPHSKFKKGEQSRLLLGGGVLGECCVPNTSPKPASVPAEG